MISRWNDDETYFYQYKDSKQLFKMFALNAGVGLAVIISVYFLSEWLIRRRAARKGA